MKLESRSFRNEEMIPSLYTCEGEDCSPHFVWSEVAPDSKSFALSAIDPDAPGGDFVHWLIINIAAETREIEEGKVPQEAEQIMNDFGKKNYGGPCPPSGVHRYFFTVYALNTEKLFSINKENFLNEVKRRTIDSAWLMGKYTRD